jgi:hypothetical protein
LKSFEYSTLRASGRESFDSPSRKKRPEANKPGAAIKLGMVAGLLVGKRKAQRFGIKLPRSFKAVKAAFDTDESRFNSAQGAAFPVH